MRREGSAFQGLGAVVLKELSDHLTSVRMRVLEWLVVLVAIAALWGAIQQIKETTAEDPFLFLRLFTTSREPLPSFVSFISFLVPLMAIGLGFDAVNSEYNRRTLSRILSQPIYRDALLFGKFIAGLMTLAISLITLWLLVVGLGLVLVGIPPGAEEISRSFLLLLVTIIYAGVWLALAMLFSILFRSAATAALVTLGLWLLITFIWPVLAGAVAQIIAPPDPRYMALGLQTPATVQPPPVATAPAAPPAAAAVDSSKTPPPATTDKPAAPAADKPPTATTNVATEVPLPQARPAVPIEKPRSVRRRRRG